MSSIDLRTTANVLDDYDFEKELKAVRKQHPGLAEAIDEIRSHLKSDPEFTKTISELYGVRCWLERAVENAGAKVTGTGIGCGEADIGIAIDGCEYLITIKRSSE